MRRVYFNCTIQELKLEKVLRKQQEAKLFQLHHTGIKTAEKAKQDREAYRFQLHHTGIKTAGFILLNSAQWQFQLHHTGIKTYGYLKDLEEGKNFNCTIQELKQKTKKTRYFFETEFQLHHTGIKTIPACRLGGKPRTFQLHHTGIKTPY